MTGRERCDRLKRIRKGLADRLGVDLHQVECTYEGECRGTCPKCKQEEQILNRALVQKGTAVAGATVIAASLAACTPPGQPVTSGGGTDIAGGITYIDDTDDTGRKSTDDGKDDGGDIEELSGEVDERHLDDDTDEKKDSTGDSDKKGKSSDDDKEPVPDDLELSGYVADIDE